jgi:SAM-dependent methyltransferase
MSARVDLYDHAYANYGAEVYRQIRVETYGQDLGQTSWATTEESEEIPGILRLTKQAHVLEVGCGSGRYALQVAEKIGCRVVGVDINGPGIETANQLSSARNMSDQVRFQICDASKHLPFADETFDAAFANDVLCHIPGRAGALREICRVVRPGGRFVFSDALVIAGTVSHLEIANRSSIGYYIFSPPGENERLLETAGFRVIDVRDTSQNAAAIARRWHDARERRKEALVEIEGEGNFVGLQLFLSTVCTVTGEGRLRRFLYVAEVS